MNVYIQDELDTAYEPIAYHVILLNRYGYIAEEYYYEAVIDRPLGLRRARHKAQELAEKYDADIYDDTNIAEW